jgi:hypothetical protein
MLLQGGPMAPEAVEARTRAAQAQTRTMTARRWHRWVCRAPGSKKRCWHRLGLRAPGLKITCRHRWRAGLWLEGCISPSSPCSNFHMLHRTSSGTPFVTCTHATCRLHLHHMHLHPQHASPATQPAPAGPCRPCKRTWSWRMRRRVPWCAQGCSLIV